MSNASHRGSDLARALPLGRPWCLLDVDGVLASLTEPTEPYVSAHHDDVPLRVPSAMPSRVQTLSAAFTLAWSSHWGHGCNDALAALLGIPLLPHVAWRAGWPSATHVKLPDIDAWAKDWPLAVVDDEADAEWESWAARRTAPTLVVRPDPRRGLTDEHVEQLLAFARPVNDRDHRGLLAHHVPRVVGSGQRMTMCGRPFPRWSRPVLPHEPRCLVCEETAPFDVTRVTSGVVPLFSMGL